VVTWLDGKPLGKSREPLKLPDAPAVFHTLGREMAKLHLACDAWTRPVRFTRCAWDAEGLLGDDPLWGRFWENPTLDADTKRLLTAFRSVAMRHLARVPDLDQGLIHADLVRENVMLDGDGQIAMIDFDDGGFGYRLFDLATALLKNRREPNYPALLSALIAGYRSVRWLDTTELDLFLCLRAVTYLGWIVPRMDEPSSHVRNARFITDAQELCGAYMQKEGVA
jgi:Ser/Thr protein kinase RdoA (MazF antagonist)